MQNVERSCPSLQLADDGAELFPRAMRDAEIHGLAAVADDILAGRPGARIAAGDIPSGVLSPDSTLSRIAAVALGSEAKPVRAVLFDKSAETNWTVGWHQDRTIVVRERRDVPGYGRWTVKDGLLQVEPPFEVTAGMITLRAHIDDCDADNAPLLVARGSHRLGRIPAADVGGVVARLGQHMCLARRGDVWLYSTAVLHASEPARRPRRRRVLQVDYACGTLAGGLEWRVLN